MNEVGRSGGACCARWTEPSDRIICPKTSKTGESPAAPEVLGKPPEVVRTTRVTAGWPPGPTDTIPTAGADPGADDEGGGGDDDAADGGGAELDDSDDGAAGAGGGTDPGDGGWAMACSADVMLCRTCA